MDRQRRDVLALLAGAATALATSRFAGAADYPSRPITLLVGFAAGGPADAYARILGVPREKLLGVPVIVSRHSGQETRCPLSATSRHSALQ